nr:MAG TPA: hypothetical protein [Caudoviricetes sp.]
MKKYKRIPRFYNLLFTGFGWHPRPVTLLLI